MDEAWAKFFAKNHFLVGLSLDGPKKIQDQFRKDAKGNGTFSKVMSALQLLDKYHVDYNIVSVITGSSQDKASYLYKFYKRNGFDFVQLIPCMEEENRQGAVVENWKGRRFLWGSDCIPESKRIC